MRTIRGALCVLLLLAPVALDGCASDTSQSAATPTAALPPASEVAQAHQYSTGGEQFKSAWQAFYGAQREPDIDDALIAAGRPMVPAICEAVAHRDMQMRRYAIGALGYIGDDAATATLLAILGDESEESYFRGDALQALYLIDEAEAVAQARRYRNAGDTLGKYSKAVLNHESWLTAPTTE